MGKIKILVADDHAMMRDGIKGLLSLHDDLQIVGEAADGQAVINLAQELTPDVIIMDIAMPIMDGLEAIRRIMKKNPKAKILVLSQHEDKEYILSAIKAGCSGYLSKRALGSDLISAIRDVYRGESFLYPAAAAALINDYRNHTQIGDAYDSLTPREREILKLIAEGKTSKEIAENLFISLKTVLGHRTKLMEKLDLRNRTDLIKYAMRKGILSLDT